ncbi:MAG: hypothetical protein K9M82_11500 [Deltaproteobacteria bacterium]|nr:hypothetical protein [Deltaproteobacteria bacterium]
MKFGTRHLTAVFAGGFLLLALLYWAVVLRPAAVERRTLEARVVDMTEDLERMRLLQDQWERFQEMRSEAERMLQRRGDGFTLLSYLEGVSRQIDISDKIQYMKPLEFSEPVEGLQPTGIEMRLERLDIQELVQFLYRVEHSENLLNVVRMKIRPSSGKTERTLELTLQVNTYR